MKKIGITALLVVSAMSFGASAHAESSEISLNEGTNIFVSRDGSDSAKGTQDAPFQTIEKAQAKASLYKLMGKKQITIYIRGGEYDTFSLKSSESGNDDTKIIYKAYPGEEVVINAGHRIESFTRLSDDDVLSGRFPEDARKNIVTYSLSGLDGDWKLKAMGNGEYVDMCARLYVDAEPMNIARWPNDGYIKLGDYASVSGKSITFSNSAKTALWALNTDAWIGGYTSSDWSFIRCSVNEINDTAVTVGGSFANTSRVYFYNIPEELDSPGEYYIDENTDTLYFYPPENMDNAKVMLAYQDSPLNIKSCKNVSIEDLVIEGTRGTGISVSYSENVTIFGCVVRACGVSGISIGESKNCTISDNHVYNVGAKGITCAQYTYIQELIEGNVLITNNRIHDYGLVTKTYAPGVYIHGVGNTASHNEIYNYGHTGIMFAGNENVFEYNDIHDILTETNDAGAIYCGKTWISRGNELRYNYIHDCVSTAGKYIVGIYLDDMMADVKCFGNVIDNVGIGFLMGGGHDNEIENNIIANSKGTATLVNSITADSRGTESWFSSNFEMAKGQSLLRDCCFIKEFITRHCLTSNAWLKKYPDLRDILRKNYREPQDNIIRNNIIYAHAGADIHENVIKNGTVENNVVFTENPGFSDPESGNYSYSGEIISGFLPIDCEKFGIIE